MFYILTFEVTKLVNEFKHDLRFRPRQILEAQIID